MLSRKILRLLCIPFHHRHILAPDVSAALTATGFKDPSARWSLRNKLAPGVSAALTAAIFRGSPVRWNPRIKTGAPGTGSNLRLPTYKEGTLPLSYRSGVGVAGETLTL